MSEFNGRGSRSERFDTFFREEVGRNADRPESKIPDDIETIKLINEASRNRERINRDRSDRRIDIERPEEKENKENKEKNTNAIIKKAGKKIISTCLAVGMAIGGIVFSADALDKGIKGNDFEQASKNKIFLEYGSTTSAEHLSESQYNEVVRGVMDGKAEKLYDARAGEGAFEDLNSEQKDALVGKTYDLYGKEENKPEELAQVSDENQKWASEYIDSRTLPEKFLGMFDKVD